MAIQTTRIVVGVVGMLIVAAVIAIGFITLTPKPQTTVEVQDVAARSWSVEVTDVQE